MYVNWNQRNYNPPTSGGMREHGFSFDYPHALNTTPSSPYSSGNALGGYGLTRKSPSKPGVSVPGLASRMPAKSDTPASGTLHVTRVSAQSEASTRPSSPPPRHVITHPMAPGRTIFFRPQRGGNPLNNNVMVTSTPSPTSATAPAPAQAILPTVFNVSPSAQSAMSDQPIMTPADPDRAAQQAIDAANVPSDNSWLWVLFVGAVWYANQK